MSIASTRNSAMCRATAGSSPYPSMSLVGPAPKFPRTRSRLFSVVPRASASAGIRRRCRCGRPYTRLYPEQRECLRCRQLYLILDDRRGDQGDQAAARALLDSAEHEGDYQIYDEQGRLVWARDLVKRYLAETRPRPARSHISRYL